MTIFLKLSLLIGSLLLFASNASAQRPGEGMPEILPPTDKALKALESDFKVRVSETELYYEFNSTRYFRKSAGVIIHPGGAIDPRAYAPLARQLALKRYRAIILRTPSELVVAGIVPSMVNTVIAEHWDIDRWALAGHSVGGVAAAQFIFENPDAESVKGLALLAAFPNPEKPITDRDDLAILSVSGSNDCLVPEDTINTFKWALPNTTSYFEIGGANHAQVGDYGPQEGDCDPDISNDAQKRATRTALIQFVLKELR